MPNARDSSIFFFERMPVVCSITIGMWLIFWRFPSIDLTVSQFFYQNGFIGARSFIVKQLHQTIPFVSILLGILPFLYVWQRQKTIKVPAILCYFFAYILGPGIWVNWILKAHWGRPRPNQILNFGGDQAFYSLSLWPTGLGGNFPSYVSGHAGLAFFVAMVGLLLDPNRKSQWFWRGFGYWLMISLVRISEGGHFLSDVVLAACYVWLFSLACLRFFEIKYCKPS